MDRIPRQQPGMMRKDVGGNPVDPSMAAKRPTTQLPGSMAPAGLGAINNKWMGNAQNSLIDAYRPNQNPYGPVNPMPRGGMPQPGQGLGRMNRERAAQGLKRINPMNPGQNQAQIQPVGPARPLGTATPMPRGGFAQTGGPDPMEGLLAQISQLYGV